MTHNSTKASQTCSGRAVSTDAISSLNKEWGREGDSALAWGVKPLDKATYRISNPAFFKLLPRAICYHKHRKFVWPRRWSSPLTCRALTYTEVCLTLAERKGWGGGSGEAFLSMDSWDFWRLSFTNPRLSYR